MINRFLHSGLLCAAAVVLLAACSSEEPVPAAPEAPGAGLRVAASMARLRYSRAYKAEGDVEEGFYRLTYPLTTGNDNYDVAQVQFGKEGATPTIGFVTLPGDQALMWSSVGGGSTPTFCLDNVDPALAAATSTPTKVVLNPANNPYKAGLFDLDGGTNDLLWGSQTARRNEDKNIHFDLHHRMARVLVQVTVDRTNENSEKPLDLEEATLEISSLNQVPLSYNRLDGTLELNEEGDENYTTLMLVNTLADPGEGAQIAWRETNVPDETNPNLSTYVTRDFVLPPQGLRGDEKRPRLTIKLKDGRIYSGILPHAMLVDNGSGAEPYPAALSFLPEYILTIRTLITEEPPQLVFMPIYLVEWVDKGQFSFDAHQAGIYTPKEFEALIAYYAVNNTYQLVRYGYLVDVEGSDPVKQAWHFDVFHGLVLDYDAIHNKMKPGTNGSDDFSFSFNNYGVSVRTGDGTLHPVSENKLYRIVTGDATLP